MKKNDRSFWALMTTQFLGAFNDNVFQIVIALLITHWMTAEEGAKSGRHLRWRVCAPFLLFSLGAGRLADRWSKARVVVVAKTGGPGGRGSFVDGVVLEECPNPIGRSLFVGRPKRLFQPREIWSLAGTERRSDLPAANALLNVASFAAILLGTVAGTFLTQHIVIVAILAGTVAIASLAAAFAIEKFPRQSHAIAEMEPDSRPAGKLELGQRG
jgi:acyl-[acyl-carrier-protein]-phospholipid O-acyltransferase/long-chain-fatty-acid--[acyl-carrier-protein] ligase